MDPPLLLLFEPGFSLLDVELVLDAGDDKFCDTVADPVADFPTGDVFTESGDVTPELFEVAVALDAPAPLAAWLIASGGVLLVLRSCGEATLVDDVESAYLQLGLGFIMPGLCVPGLVWCRCVAAANRCGWSCV